jgi:hypothetical protein
MKRTKLKKFSEKGLAKRKEKTEITKKLHEFFLNLWDERELFNGTLSYCKCEETGKILTREFYRENSCCYSHILSKSKYPELAFKKENIMIVSPDAHAQYELNPEKTPNQLKRKLELLK